MLEEGRRFESERITTEGNFSGRVSAPDRGGILPDESFQMNRCQNLLHRDLIVNSECEYRGGITRLVERDSWQ